METMVNLSQEFSCPRLYKTQYLKMLHCENVDLNEFPSICIIDPSQSVWKHSSHWNEWQTRWCNNTALKLQAWSYLIYPPTTFANSKMFIYWPILIVLQDIKSINNFKFIIMPNSRYLKRVLIAIMKLITITTNILIFVVGYYLRENVIVYKLLNVSLCWAQTIRKYL
jgi:hypothetical protein